MKKLNKLFKRLIGLLILLSRPIKPINPLTNLKKTKGNLWSPLVLARIRLILVWPLSGNRADSRKMHMENPTALEYFGNSYFPFFGALL